MFKIWHASGKQTSTLLLQDIPYILLKFDFHKVKMENPGNMASLS